MSYVFVSNCSVSHVYSVVILPLAYSTFQGMVVGALLNMPLVDKVGFGNVSYPSLNYRFSFHKTPHSFLDARDRVSLADVSVFR